MESGAFQFSRVRGGYTLAERVYSSVKDAILSLQLKPGSPLVEDELARQLGTSKTPVRDALLALERDGLVTKIPYKGTYVAELNQADAVEIFELRSVLEGLASRLAARELTPQDIAEAERLLAEADEARLRGELTEASLLGEQFHQVILRRARNTRLHPILLNLDEQMRRLRLISNQFVGRLEKSAYQHRVILDALRAGDPAQVEKAMRAHLDSVLDDLLAERPAQASPENGHFKEAAT
jgi:DNA-binding GntR family transcriptional regulator